MINPAASTSETADCLISVADPGSRLREGNNSGNRREQQLGIGASEALERRNERHALQRHQLRRRRARALEQLERELRHGGSDRTLRPRWDRGRLDARRPRWTAASDDVGVTATGSTATEPWWERRHRHGVSRHDGRAGRTYDYQVRAVDAAGHESGPSETRRSGRPHRALRRGGRRPHRAGKPGKNTGRPGRCAPTAAATRTRRRTCGYRSGATGPITSARLRVRTGTDTADGPAAYATDWTGHEAAHLEQPSRADQRSNRRQGRTRDSTWVEYDVTSLVAGDGHVVSYSPRGPATASTSARARTATPHAGRSRADLLDGAPNFP